MEWVAGGVIVCGFDWVIRHPRQGFWRFEGSMVGREKARFYGVSENWKNLDSSGARGFRAGGHTNWHTGFKVVPR